ncbi:GGDEF domain-containing protein, partial [Acidovorax lacteus]
AATQRLSRGEYDTPLEHMGRQDEIGNLARAFDRMRLDVAAQQSEIRRLAYWDRLTGLPNREQFREALGQAIAAGRMSGEPLAVVTLDLDRFKHVNDVLGFAFGDRLLQAVASRLQALVEHPGDLVARLGGNAFALLLLRTDAVQAQAMAQRVAQAFEEPLALEDQTVDLSAGMGIACCPGPASDADTLLSHSEIAMYVAKRRLSGPLLYDAAFDSSSSQNLSLLTELRRAVDQGELRLYLQPKVPLQAQSGLAAEALVRWMHPQRGLVPPMQFIPFAEQTGFVRQLTLWVFEAAARLLATPSARACGLRVSVNLSTRDLLDPDLSARLATVLQRHGVQAHALCLEITESAIMDDPTRAEAMLNRLSEQGFKLSIDDFGTGYSSLAYLKRLPVDELKIDKSFVMGMEQDEDDATIVRSTIDLAHNLGLSVVAEGVETAAIQERLRALSCDEAQGYHISRPMPQDEFWGWQAQQLPAAGR